MLTITACAFQPAGTSSDDPSDVDAAAPTASDAAVDAPTPETVECRVEESRLGVVGLQVDIEGVLIAFESWTRHPDDLERVIGFTLSPNAEALSYTVRLGNRDTQASGRVFQSPDGRGGPRAITRIEFCD
jgi:hypothetical protein